MADKNLVQHIDKISYAVAGVVGLVLLVLPVVSGGNLGETRMSLNDAVDDLKKKKREQEQDFPTLSVRGLKAEIQAQWKPGSGGESQTWITGAAPCLLKRVMSVQQRAATHSPGTITEISAHRDGDKKQVYLIVKGVMGADNEFVTIDSVLLSRREGAAGSFRPVGTFKGDFEFKDFRVKAGETYSYMFTSIASRDSSAPRNILPPDVAEQESAELATPAIPYDFSVNLRQTFRAEEVRERPTIMANFSYWDYASNKEAGKGLGRYTEKDVIGGRYQIGLVDPSKRMIEVKDGLRRTKHFITTKDEAYSLELWPPVIAVVEDEPAEDEVEVGADPATAPAPTTPVRPRGFRKFK